MSKNPNNSPNIKKSIKNVTAVAALALAANGIAMAEAGASSLPKAEHNSSDAPLRALTKLINEIEQGKSVEVTANNIYLPGPIGEGMGQPIVYNVKEKGHEVPYLAYTQDQIANFDQKTALGVAKSMAIIREPIKDIGIPLEQAHLNKDAQLVDPNEMWVGYSIAGDQAK